MTNGQKKEDHALPTVYNDVTAGKTKLDKDARDIYVLLP